MDSEGIQVFSITTPTFFTIRVWTADRILADFAAPCGVDTRIPQPALGEPPFKEEWQTTLSETWIIDRKRETAELIEHPCLGAKTYRWTIEDPPFWKEAKERLKGR